MLRHRRKIQAENEISNQVYRWGRYTDGRPRPRDRRRWLSCKRDLGAFLKTYMPRAFPLDWSADHQVAIERIQSAVLHGGQSAVAMPRGNGKTTICEGATIWALAYGHRQYPAVIGATKDAAESILASIKREIEDNSLLAEDFPGMCVPISALDGKPIRAKSQLIDGRLSKVGIKADQMQFAAIKCDSCGANLVALALTGNLRGARRKMPDGSVQRPDFVFLDDPQTDESAASPTQTDTRESLVTGAILGLAGPDVRIAALMACTVIEDGDLSDRVLERPEWRGVRTALVTAWPDCGRPDDRPDAEMPQESLLWRRYAEIRRTSLRAGTGGSEATEFYAANRQAMDRGAVVSWPDRYLPGQMSALQYAMDIYIDRGPQVFFAEYQNNPTEARRRAVYTLTAERVARNLSSLPVRTAHERDTFVGGFIDINHYGAHWTLISCEANMTGHIIDYGRYPARGRLVPEGANKSEISAAIYRGIAALVTALGEYTIERSGRRTGIDAMLLDCGYEMETVFRLCEALKPPFRLLPSRGVPCSKFRPSRAIGKPRNHCHLTEYLKRGQLIEHDADWWRRQTQIAFLSDPGQVGALSVYGDDETEHGDFSRHIVAEYLREYLRGDVTEAYTWGHIPGSIHDWLDSTVGAWVACCMLGADFDVVDEQAPPPGKRTGKRRRAKVHRR